MLILNHYSNFSYYFFRIVCEMSDIGCPSLKNLQHMYFSKVGCSHHIYTPNPSCARAIAHSLRLWMIDYYKQYKEPQESIHDFREFV